MISNPRRTTIFLGPSLKALRDTDPAGNFSSRLEQVAQRYQAMLAESVPKTLSVDDWRTLFPILQTTTFAQPGDAFLLALRLKSAGSPLAYKLEAMKLAELIAIIELGQALLSLQPEPTDEQIRTELRARA